MSPDPAVRRATPLAVKLKAQIAAKGPISVAAYMRACLDDPEHGYYRTRTAIGRDGDFITGPEISQIFGELMGLWAAVVWQQMGAPARFILIELGPGRGTMMVDALRAARVVPGFLSAAQVALVEPNPRLVAVQRVTLSGAAADIAWYGELDGVPPGPSIVLANEVVDVLPVSQVVKMGNGWSERGVGIDAAGQLAFVAMPSGIDAPVVSNAGQGDIVERRDCSALVGGIARHSRQHPVAGLFIDYGYAGPALGDTLQAVRGHAWEYPLASPGEADLTAHVDFGSLAQAFRREGLACDGPVAQAALLGRLGIIERASRLMSANPLAAASIEAAVARLMAPGGMGGRFLALGVRSDGLAILPGLDGGMDRGRRGT